MVFGGSENAKEMSTTKRLTLRMPTSLYAKLEAECTAAGSKVNPAINRILKYSLGLARHPPVRPTRKSRQAEAGAPAV